MRLNLIARTLVLILPLMVLINCKEKVSTEGQLFSASFCTYENQAACEASIFRCFWASTANSNGRQCFSKDICESDRPASACGSDSGCVYNTDSNNSYCLSKKTSPCDWATVEGACSEIWECVWSADGKVNGSGETQHCFGTLPIPSFLGGYSCADYPQDICATNGCIYDEGATKCLSRLVGSCTAFTTESTCASAGCLWNAAGSSCLSVNPLTTSCGDFTAFGKTTCEAAGCLFDDKATPAVCASKYIGCRAYELPLDSCPIGLGCRVSEDGLKCESENCNFNVTKTDCAAQTDCNWDNLFRVCRNPSSN